MFYAISDQLFTRFTTSPRASFFGSTICFFNGYLRSISRQAENGTDREKLLLTFERADNYPDSGKKGETAAQSNTATSEPALEDQTGGKSSRSVAVLPDDWGTNTDGRVFLWYKLGGIEDFKAQGVPEIFSEKTINYLPYELGYTSVSMSDSDEHDIREFYHVIYDGQILPLYSLGYNPYYQNGLALFERDGVLWLGIESNES
ncbi:TPA: hypothetical protein P0E12_004954 [Vibrio harveyi]|nr:hypothetical protein [Vibrio harveyi]